MSDALDSITNLDPSGNAMPVVADDGPSWRDWRPRLRDDLVFRPQRVRARTVFVVEDVPTSKFYRIGAREYGFLASLDGRTTIGDALRLSQTIGPKTAAADEPPLSEQDAIALLSWAQRHKLWDGCSRVGEEGGAASRPYANPWNPIFFRISLGNPEPIVSRLERHWQWLFGRPAWIVMLCCVAFAAVRVLPRWEAFLTCVDGVFSPAGQVNLVICWVVLKVLHELSHGIVCKRYGGTLRDAGVAFLLFVPIAYIDVTSSWRFRSKWQRIHTALAGMQMELAVAALAAIAWSYSPPGALNQSLANLVIMASLTTLLFNANPLMRFDGYYVLADLLGLPNLYADSQRWLRSALSHFFLGTSASAAMAHADVTPLVRIYAVLALIWRWIVCAGLIVAAGYLWQGAGVVLAIAATLLWFGIPLLKFARFLMLGTGHHRPSLSRFAMTSALAITAAVGALYLIPSPGAITFQALVVYDPATVVRADGDGFVEAVFVSAGEWVEAGQPIARMRNREVIRDVAQLELELAASQIRARRLQRQRALAELDVAREDAATIEKQLVELRAEAAALLVRAPVSGRVVTRNVKNLVGVRLQRGDPLMELGNERCKQVRFHVQEDLVPLVGGSSDHIVYVSWGSISSMPCRLRKIDPRATTEPLSPALCAPYGGTLVVENVEQRGESRPPTAGLKLLAPHFTASAQLTADQASQLRAGQRVVVTLGTSRASLGHFALDCVGQWFERRKAAAA